MLVFTSRSPLRRVTRRLIYCDSLYAHYLGRNGQSSFAPWYPTVVASDGELIPSLTFGTEHGGWHLVCPD